MAPPQIAMVAPPAVSVAPTTAAPDPGALPSGQVSKVPVPVVTHLYVQVGAFSNQQNAARLAARLGGDLKISAIQRNGQTLYRVRLGPFNSTSDADAALSKISSLGSNDAHIVVDQ